MANGAADVTFNEIRDRKCIRVLLLLLLIIVVVVVVMVVFVVVW